MKTLKTVISAVIATACLSGLALAGSVDYTAVAAYLTRADGSTLVDGSVNPAFIEMGYFTITDGAVLAGKTDPATLAASFVMLQTGNVGDFGNVPAGADGAYGEDFTASFDTSTGNGAYHAAVGHNIYVWAFNGTAFNTGGEQGIYKSSSLFPTDVQTVGNSLFDLNDLFTSGTILAGSLGVGTVSGSLGDMAHVNLEAIPEPSTYLLVVSGLLGMLAMRRRS
jgi:hypothetical protein